MYQEVQQQHNSKILFSFFLFIQHIFQLEQEEYTKEGIDWNEIKFVDNKPLLVSATFS